MLSPEDFSSRLAALRPLPAPEAALGLRQLLAPGLGYSELARLQRFAAQTAAKLPPGQRQARIAVISSSTTALWVPLLRTLCFRDGIDAEFYEGPFGNYQQEILDPDSGLYRFNPTIVVLAVHWRDLGWPPFAADPAAAIESQVERWRGLWHTFAARSSAHLIQFAFDRPSVEAGGYLSIARQDGRERMILRLNDQLWSETSGRSVSLLDTPRVALETGLHRWSDAALWHKAKQHPGLDALPALAESALAQFRALLGLTRKVVVCDLDNTLWGGVIGEDGLDGIRLGPGTADGEAHVALQVYLKELAARGILLAVNSKNNLDDALLPFTSHPGMVLRREDFASFEANWTDKASNLRAMAQALSLGTDSFVFLDDNPVEREWVRSRMPEVAVPEPGSPNSIATGLVLALERGRYFESLALSAEDTARASHYQREVGRREKERVAGSMEEFLSGLGMHAAAVPVNDGNLERITQLTNKTNQYNLTTRRYTKAQVEALAYRNDGWLQAFELRDSFGDYGLVGCVFCLATGDGIWEVDTWLMSCRVLGRQMELFMMDHLVAAAQSHHVRELWGVYRPTAKNGLTQQHYPNLGFETITTNLEPSETRYRLEVPAQWSPRAVFINQAAKGST